MDEYPDMEDASVEVTFKFTVQSLNALMQVVNNLFAMKLFQLLDPTFIEYVQNGEVVLSETPQSANKKLTDMQFNEVVDTMLPDLKGLDE